VARGGRLDETSRMYFVDRSLCYTNAGAPKYPSAETNALAGRPSLERVSVRVALARRLNRLLRNVAHL
jgi:hypothetical protein